MNEGIVLLAAILLALAGALAGALWLGSLGTPPAESQCSAKHDYEQVHSPDGGYMFRVYCRACGDTKESI